MKQRISNAQKIYKEGVRLLEDAGVEEAGLDAWHLLEHVSGITRAAYYAHPDLELDVEQEEAYFAYVRRRARRIPLQHITGEQEFMGYPFYVNGHVLIPRQDTELLVEEALGMLAPGMRVLDMCTGSGCILISLLKAGRERRHIAGLYGTGTDISQEALQVAERNARRLLGGRGAEEEAGGFRFCQGDLFENAEGKYDLIVSNPPYIRTKEIKKLQPEVQCHDPYIALDGRDDGLHYYRRITAESTAHITEGGHLLFETGHDQAEAVCALMEQAGYHGIFVKKDLAGLDRVVGGSYNRTYTGL